MDAINFIALSSLTKEALKSATLLKSLRVNAIIEGERGVGKTTLARFIMPSAPVIDAQNQDELIETIGSYEKIIIQNFDKVKNFENFKKLIENKSLRIIATTSSKLNEKVFDSFFSIGIFLAPFSERKEDVEALAKLFFKEASEIFRNETEPVLNSSEFNLSLNAHSLRRSVFLQYLLSSIEESEIMHTLESYFYEHLGGKNEYRDFLYLYDGPIINAGIRKFKSQLKLSEHLGLNRNTLRKKILDLKEHYEHN